MKFLEWLIGAALLAATVGACSKDPVAPLHISVLYANRSTHVNTGAPGIAVLTWLSPETVGARQHQGAPGGGNDWYGPGFRTDTVGPNEVKCVSFEAPSGQVAVQYRVTLPGAILIGYPGTSSTISSPGQITWHSESSWGFTGDFVAPAGSLDSFGNVVEGC